MKLDRYMQGFYVSSSLSSLDGTFLLVGRYTKDFPWLLANCLFVPTLIQTLCVPPSELNLKRLSIGEDTPPKLPARHFSTDSDEEFPPPIPERICSLELVVDAGRPMRLDSVLISIRITSFQGWEKC